MNGDITRRLAAIETLANPLAIATVVQVRPGVEEVRLPQPNGRVLVRRYIDEEVAGAD